MNLTEFFDEAARLDISLALPVKETAPSHTLSNEALFQLPLLAMTILALSKSSSKPIMSEVGQLVGECLERTVAGFKGSSQDIGWSGNLRIRTIKALTFLETTHLVTVDKRTRRISATDIGRNVYEGALHGDSPLALSLRTVEISYQHIREENRARGELI